MHRDAPISPQDWWPCDFAYRWLREELLPQVQTWIYRKEFNSTWARIFNKKQSESLLKYIKENVFVQDIREVEVFSDGAWNQGIISSIEILQQFFNTEPLPTPYIKKSDVEALYRAAAALATSGKGYIGYIKSNLSLKSNPENHSELIKAINESIQRKQVGANAYVVDCALRAILELCGGNEKNISTKDHETLTKALIPFAEIHKNISFIKRHGIPI